MQAFSISCTTCKTRLKVRRVQLIGQILPCPKCGGMVLIEWPTSPDDAPLEAGHSPRKSASHAPQPPLPPSDSFDHIDDLLDGKLPPISTASRSASTRWRVPTDKDKAPAQPTRTTKRAHPAKPNTTPPSTAADRFAAGLSATVAPVGELPAASGHNPTSRGSSPAQHADVEGPTNRSVSTGSELPEPSPGDTAAEKTAAHTNQTRANPVPAGGRVPAGGIEDFSLSTRSEVPETGAESTAARPEEWMSRQVAGARSWLLMGLGAVVGVGTAFGVAGWILSASSDSRKQQDASIATVSDELSPPPGRNSPSDATSTPIPPARSKEQLTADEVDPNAQRRERRKDDDQSADQQVNDSGGSSSMARQGASTRGTDGAPSRTALGQVDTNTEAEASSTGSRSRQTESTTKAQQSEDPLLSTRENDEQPEVESNDTEQPDSESSLNASSDEYATKGDELANFARWLQTASPTDPMVKQGPESGTEIPQTDVAAQAKSRATMGSETTGDLSSEAVAIGMPVEPDRGSKPLVNAEMRLNRTISALRFRDVPLVDTMRTLSSLSGVPIWIDPDALGRSNRPADYPVNLVVRDERFRDVARQILGPIGLQLRIDEGHACVTTLAEAQQRLIKVRHDVDDLVRGDPSVANKLARSVTKLFDHGGWDEPDGTVEGDPQMRRSCQADGTTLVVIHRETVQYQILVFFETLRVAQGLPRQSPILDDRIRLGRPPIEAFEEKVNLKFWRDAALIDIVQQIESQSPVRILLDWPSIEQVGWTFDDRFTLLVLDLPLGELLEGFLAPRGLAYRVVDDQTLQVTSAEKAASELVVEVFPGIKADQLRSLSDKIVARVGSDRFQPTGTGLLLSFDGVLISSLPELDQRVVAEIVGR